MMIKENIGANSRTASISESQRQGRLSVIEVNQYQLYIGEWKSSDCGSKP